MQEKHLKRIFDEIDNLSQRLGLEGNGETDDQDHLTLEWVLDIIDFISKDKTLKSKVEIFLDSQIN
jgi:hypothetical protein